MGAYLAGLLTLITYQDVDTIVAGLSGDPVATLLGSSPLDDPAALVVAGGETLLAGTLPDLVILLGVGAIVMPLVVGLTVWLYGSGSAYAYPVGLAVPLVWLAVRPSVSPSLGVDLITLLVLPLLAGLAFIVDTGRYLRATKRPRNGARD